MAQRASVRVSFRWVPDVAEETQDVLALNVGGYFVDLRFSLNEKTIEWAMAGKRPTLAESPCQFPVPMFIDEVGRDKQ